MDPDSLEAMNEIHQSVYRTAVKLQTLQRLCRMDVVFVRHAAAALRSAGGATASREEVTRVLNRMFHSASREAPGRVTPPEETTNLVFAMFDRGRSGHVAARSLHTALIALCADTPQVKFTGLLSVSDDGSGSVSRSGLRSLLQDLGQIPAAVQEERAFGGVEAAVKSCFGGVLTPTVSQQRVLSWLQSEPRLLLWLPTLYRLSVSHNVTHNVRCHTCKTAPITGLRFRCLKCLNVHVCQSCFLSLRQTRKHKSRHPVLEFCTQPTWKESLSSFMHNTRHALLPRRYTQRETVRKRILMWAEPEDTENSAPPPLEAATGLADSVPASSPEERDGSAIPSPQTTDDTSEQAAALLSDVRSLQRDKRLLEAELQEWRVIVQSEQGDLEYRCSEMEVTVETLRRHNTHLEDMLTQALNNRRDVNDLDRGHINELDRGQNSDTDNGHVSDTDRRQVYDRGQKSDTGGGHVSDADRRQLVETDGRQTNDEDTREVSDTDRGHVNDMDRGEVKDQDREELGETERGRVGNMDRKHDDNTDSGQVKGADRGQVKDTDRGQVKDTDRGQVKDTDRGQARDTDRGQVRDTDRGQVRDTDRGQVKDTDSGQVKDTDRGQVKDTDRGHVRDTDRGQVKDTDRGHVKDIDRGQVKDTDRGHVRDTDRGQVKDTDRGQDGDIETGHVSDTDTEHERYTDGGEITPSSDTQRNTEEEDEEEEELMKTMGEWSDEELETPSPTIHQHLAESHECYCEEEEEEEESEDVCLHQRMRSQNGTEEAGLREDTRLSEGEDDDDETRRPEDLLQETVNQLKTVMETDGWTQTGVTKRAELVRAAEQVGDSILHLVDSVK